MITTLLKLVRKKRDKKEKGKVDKNIVPTVRPQSHTIFADKINREDRYWFI